MGAIELAFASVAVLATIVAGVALWRLRAAGLRYRVLLDHLPQTAVASFDHELRVTLAAGSALELAGRPAHEIEGHADTRLLNVS